MADHSRDAIERGADVRALAAQLLRAIGGAVLIAAGTIAVVAWIETWEDVGAFGVATYLFWPMLVGALVLLGSATRLYPSGSDRADDVSTQPQ